jgi:hypothetical protein
MSFDSIEINTGSAHGSTIFCSTTARAPFYYFAGGFHHQISTGVMLNLLSYLFFSATAV